MSGEDGGVPRPPFSVGNVPCPDTFGAWIFWCKAGADMAKPQSAGQIVELLEDLETAMDDINVLRRENKDLREELSNFWGRQEVMLLKHARFAQQMIAGQ